MVLSDSLFDSTWISYAFTPLNFFWCEKLCLWQGAHDAADILLWQRDSSLSPCLFPRIYDTSSAIHPD